MAVNITLSSPLARRMTLLGISLPLWVLLVVRVLAFAGVQWDVAWHRTLGRDSFWSPPHLLIYISLGIVTLIAAWSLRRWGWSRGNGCIVVGGAIVYLSAPFDELWHQWYGIDVDIWSPPHLTGIFGAFVIALGSVYLLVGELREQGRLDWRESLRPLSGARAADWMLIIFIGLLVTTPLFAMGRYTIVAWTRDAVLYPIMGALAVPVIAIANLRATGRRWTATLTAAFYIALMLVVAGIVAALQLKPVSLSPFLLLPALAIDLFYLKRRRTDGLGAGALAGTLFALTFYWTEYFWRILLVGDSWPRERMLIGFPLTLVAGAFSGGLGYVFGNSIRSQSQPKEK